MRRRKSSQSSVEILTQISREGFTFKVKAAVPLALLVLIISAVAELVVSCVLNDVGGPITGLPAVFLEGSERYR